MNGQELVEWSLRVLRDESLPIAARQAEKEWLSDRGWGKAVETIVLEDDRESAGLPAPTPEALEAIAGAPDGNLQ
ncbi:MAG TPA: hypothetical protein VFP65_26440 [Anaeromyxobacteraceae bacterium]|nr:hypothetical protein [Anaeromyxobacteraceae bacterium]